jgi:hypothetical protein
MNVAAQSRALRVVDALRNAGALREQAGLRGKGKQKRRGGDAESGWCQKLPMLYGEERFHSARRFNIVNPAAPHLSSS